MHTVSGSQTAEAPKTTEWGQVIRTIWAGLTPFGSELKQEKVLLRKIRFQVLDCRSGKPIQNRSVEKVLIDGEPAVRFLNTAAWDYVTHYIIPANAKGPLDWTGFTKKNSKLLQGALNALVGYNCDTPKAAMTDDGWKALEAYQTAWYTANHQDQPGKFKKAIENVWVQRIVAQYNENFHRAVQVDLTGLGYDCQNDDGQWKKPSEDALANCQKVELGATNPYTTFNTALNKGARQELAKKLKEAKKHFFTDAEGVVHIPVPVAKIEIGFKLKISFHDFAMVLEERDFARILPLLEETNFLVEWEDGTQDKAGGSWCWRLRPPFNTSARGSLPEFRYFLEMQVPAAPTKSWRDLDESARDGAKFSPFFASTLWDLGRRQPEFVAFALIWSQPVFDDIDDPSEPHNINRKSYLDPDLSLDLRATVRGRHMHIVTQALALSGKLHAGKGYGKIEANVASPKWRANGHPGIDLYAKVGDKIFSLHAGTAWRNINSDGGQNVTVSWKGHSIACLHFSEFQVANGAWVKAGEVIGLAGRTGNFSPVYSVANPTVAPPSKYPGHTHLNIHSNGYDSGLHQQMVEEDPVNAICLVTNDFPLMFPCACQVTAPDTDPSGCQFQDKHFTDSCWAVAELRCPYMFGAKQSPFRLQAQLRYLFDKHQADGYVDPGPVNGNIGDVPTAAKPNASQTRQAILTFMAKEQSMSSYQMTAAAWARLDELAQVEEPES
jgi:murein DD-endopeptidase MepM/ murein hydrolase activator NlpD